MARFPICFTIFLFTLYPLIDTAVFARQQGTTGGRLLDAAIIGTGFRQYEDRIDRGLPAGPILFVAVPISLGETIVVGKYIPVMERSRGKTEFHLAYIPLPPTDPQWHREWVASGSSKRFIDYFLAPKCTETGVAVSRHIFYPPMTSEQAVGFHQRHGPVVCELIQAGAFDRPYAVFLGEVEVPEAAKSGVRAGFARRLPEGYFPYEASSSFRVGEPVFAYVEVALPRLRQSATFGRRTQVLVGKEPIYEWSLPKTLNAEDGFIGWPLRIRPDAISRPGTYTFQHYLNNMLIARLSLTITSR